MDATWEQLLNNFAWEARRHNVSAKEITELRTELLDEARSGLYKTKREFARAVDSAFYWPGKGKSKATHVYTRGPDHALESAADTYRLVKDPSVIKTIDAIGYQRSLLQKQLYDIRSKLYKAPDLPPVPINTQTGSKANLQEYSWAKDAEGIIQSSRVVPPKNLLKFDNPHNKIVPKNVWLYTHPDIVRHYGYAQAEHIYNSIVLGSENPITLPAKVEAYAMQAKPAFSLYNTLAGFDVDTWSIDGSRETNPVPNIHPEPSVVRWLNKKLLTRNLDKERIAQLSSYTTPNMTGFLKPYTAGDPHSRILLSVDTETDDKGRILTVAAHLAQLNYKTGQMEAANVPSEDLNYFRVYAPNDVDENINKTQQSHGLSLKGLLGMRASLGANYGLVYDKAEMKDFFKFASKYNPMWIGQNVMSADYNWLVKRQSVSGQSFPVSYVDTLDILQTIYGLGGEGTGISNKLWDAFEREFGYSPSKLGVQAHDASHDTIVATLLLGKLASRTDSIGKAVRIALNSDNIQTNRYNIQYDDKFSDIFKGMFHTVGGKDVAIEDAEDTLEWAKQNGYDPESGKSLKEFLDEFVESPIQGPSLGNAYKNALDVQLSDINIIKGQLHDMVDSVKSMTGYNRRDKVISYMANIMKGSSWSRKELFGEHSIPTKYATVWSRMIDEYAGRGIYSTAQDKMDILQSARQQIKNENAGLTEEKLYALEAAKSILTPKQFKEFAERTDDITESFKDYNNELKKTIAGNERLTKTMSAIHSATKSFYDPTRWYQAEIQGIGQVGDAVGHLAPRFLHQPISIFTKALQQARSLPMEDMRYAVSATRQIGNAAMAAGTGIMTLIPGGQLIGAGIMGAGAALSLGSNLYGEYKEKKITKSYTELASQINFVAAGFKLLLAPLAAFRSGLGGLFNIWGRLTNIVSTQYGVPLTSLTGIRAPAYSALMTADAAFGMKPGSLNAMHNRLSYGQTALYSSGQFDAQRLTAAARLGVFSQVYAPMGGNAVGQYASIVDTLSGRLAGLSDNSAEAQYIMYGSSLIDENLPNVLQRMKLWRRTGKYKGSFSSFSRGDIFDVGIRHMNDYENADWEWAAAGLNAGRTGFHYGLKRLAVPLWNSYGRPIMKAANVALDGLVNAFSAPGGITQDRLREIGTTFWNSITEALNIKDLSFGDIKGKITDWIAEPLSQGIWSGIMKAMESIAAVEYKMIDSLVTPIADAYRYISSIKIETKFGIPTSFSLPTTLKDKTIENAASIMSSFRANIEPGTGLVKDAYKSEQQKAAVRAQWKAITDKYPGLQMAIDEENATVEDIFTLIEGIKVLEKDPNASAWSIYEALKDPRLSAYTGLYSAAELGGDITRKNYLKSAASPFITSMTSNAKNSIAAAQQALSNELKLTVTAENGAKVRPGDAETAKKTETISNQQAIITYTGGR